MSSASEYTRACQINNSKKPGTKGQTEEQKFLVPLGTTWYFTGRATCWLVFFSLGPNSTTKRSCVFVPKGAAARPDLPLASPLSFWGCPPAVNPLPHSNRDRQLWTVLSSKVIKGFADFSKSKMKWKLNMNTRRKKKCKICSGGLKRLKERISKACSVSESFRFYLIQYYCLFWYGVKKKGISEMVAVSQSGISKEFILISKKPVCCIAQNCAWLVLGNKTSFNLHVPTEMRFVEGLSEKIPSFLKPHILNILSICLPSKAFFFIQVGWDYERSRYLWKLQHTPTLSQLFPNYISRSLNYCWLNSI